MCEGTLDNQPFTMDRVLDARMPAIKLLFPSIVPPDATAGGSLNASARNLVAGRVEEAVFGAVEDDPIFRSMGGRAGYDKLPIDKKAMFIDATIALLAEAEAVFQAHPGG